jgi:hypothetical protein
MKENIELGQKREFGDIVNDTFVFIKQNFVPLLKCYLTFCGLFLVAGILIAAFSTSRPQEYFDTDERILSTLMKMVWGIIEDTAISLTLFSYLAVYREKGNIAPSVIEVWGYFRYYFFRVFITYVILVILTVISVFLCFVPCIYLGVVFSLVCPIMVMENGSIGYSIRRSFKIIKENWWFTFGTLLIIIIITMMAVAVFIVPVIVIWGGSNWLTGLQFDTTFKIVYASTFQVCRVLFLVPLMANALLYFSLNEQKEGSSLANKIKMFGKTGPGTPKQATDTEQY